MISWTIFAVGSAAAQAPDRPAFVLRELRQTHPLLLTAPELPAPPADLPGLPLRTPGEAHCTAAGADLGPGTWLPQAWDVALHLRLEQANMLPAKMQARLDELGVLALVAVDAETKAIRAEDAVERANAQVPRGYSIWTVAAWTGGGVVTAGVVGFIVGFVLGGH